MIPSISASSNDQIASGVDTGLSTMFDIPFTFDHSGWNVSVKSSGSQSATSAAGATGGPSSGTGAGMAIDPMYLLIGAAIYFFARR